MFGIIVEEYIRGGYELLKNEVYTSSKSNFTKRSASKFIDFLNNKIGYSKEDVYDIRLHENGFRYIDYNGHKEILVNSYPLKKFK